MTIGRRTRQLLNCAIAALVIAAVPTFAWWYIARAEAAPTVVEIDIPAGTAALISAGETPEVIPQDLRLRSDSRILLRNQDAEAHRIGPVTILPGAASEVEAAVFAAASGASTAAFLCTFHPAGVIGMDFASGGASFTLAVLLTLLVAFPLTAASFGVISITDRLST